MNIRIDADAGDVRSSGRYAMNIGHLLKRRQWVPSSLEDVFGFFSDAANLEELTPPWLHLHILTPQPVAMSAGTLIDYRLKWHGFPLNWQTAIVRWQPPNIFEDWQLKGPYRLWHHVHTFESINGGTLVSDSVRYALPFGVLGHAVHSLTVRTNLNAIFAYRAARVWERFGDGSHLQVVRS